MTLGTWIIWGIFVLAVLAFVVRGELSRATVGGAMWAYVAVAGALLSWFLMAAIMDILDEAPAAPTWQLPVYLVVGIVGLLGAFVGMFKLRRSLPPSQRRVEREREKSGLTEPHREPPGP